MCAPLAALPFITAGLGALGSGVGTYAKIQQDNAQAAVATSNANAERQAAAQDQTNMNQAALQRYMQISQVEGQQRATQAANGVVVDFGTAGQQVADTALTGSMDVNKIYQTGFQAQRGHDVKIANDLATASADRSNAVLTGVGGAFGAASTVLGGATQYEKLQNLFGSPGTDSYYSPTSQFSSGTPYAPAFGFSSGVRMPVQLPPNF